MRHRITNGRGDEEVREMLRDISSLVNAFGGDFLMGVQKDDDGVAVGLKFRVNDPVVVSLSLFNIRGFALTKGPQECHWNMTIRGLGPTLWMKQHLEIPPRQTPSMDEPDKVARERLDRLWQAFNFDSVPLDRRGNFRPE